MEFATMVGGRGEIKKEVDFPEAGEDTALCDKENKPPRIGAITFIYSVTKRGWVFPGLSVIRNPLKAQRLAEAINNKRGLYD